MPSKPLYRAALPQLRDDLFLTDGGLETTLIFLEGISIPDFASFTLLKAAAGREAIRKYFRSYVELARKYGTGLILESATWRASPDWAARNGYTRESLAEANRSAIEILEEVRAESDARQSSDGMPAPKIVVSGCLGPRGDGYIPGQMMTAEAAEAYHRDQMETFADTAADMACVMTMNYASEAIGVVRAAMQTNMPIAVSFTVEIDGKLPTGQSLADAITEVDAATDAYPSYFMINCAHPTHFSDLLAEDHASFARLRGLRANASRMSHAELNEAAELDIGDPREFGELNAELAKNRPQLTVIGGCCGTDLRHIEQVAKACANKKFV